MDVWDALDLLVVEDVSESEGTRTHKITIGNFTALIAGSGSVSFSQVLGDPLSNTSLAAILSNITAGAASFSAILGAPTSNTSLAAALAALLPLAGGTLSGALHGTSGSFSSTIVASNLSGSNTGDQDLSVLQPKDATLTALAGLTITANSLSIGTGTDAFSQTAFAANTFPAHASTGGLSAKPITDLGLSLVAASTANAAAHVIGLGTTDTATFAGLNLAGGYLTGTSLVTNGVCQVNLGTGVINNLTSSVIDFTGTQNTNAALSFDASNNVYLSENLNVSGTSTFTGTITGTTASFASITAGGTTLNSDGTSEFSGSMSLPGGAQFIAGDTPLLDMSGGGVDAGPVQCDTVNGNTVATGTGSVVLANGSGDVAISGNLTVSGTTTQINSTNEVVADPLVKQASGNTSSDVVDIGFYGPYHPASTTLFTGVFRDASDGKYKFFAGLQAEPTTTVNIAGSGYTVATIVANVEGATGSFSGNVTGGAFTGPATGLTGTAASLTAGAVPAAGITSGTSTAAITNLILVTPNIGAASGTGLLLSSLTASLPVVTDSSKNLVSIAHPTQDARLTGTAYSLTATSAAIVGGTTSPTLTITDAGTYRMEFCLVLNFNGATFAADKNVTLKLRRTNNTATDLTSGTMPALHTGVVTTFTSTWGAFCWVAADYTATAGDVVTVFGDVATVPSAGSLDVIGGFLRATRVY